VLLARRKQASRPTTGEGEVASFVDPETCLRWQELWGQAVPALPNSLRARLCAVLKGGALRIGKIVSAPFRLVGRVLTGLGGLITGRGSRRKP
jgi:hypothetical protein